MSIDHIEKFLLYVKDVLNIEDEIQLKRDLTHFQAELSWNEQSRILLFLIQQFLESNSYQSTLSRRYFSTR